MGSLDILYDETKDRLDKISPSFCAAKWLQLTLHLHIGFTHSCYLPKYHKIPLDELEKDFHVLHNTSYKKEQRRKMLEGERPEECSYCWNIEDSDTRSPSDRVVKSSDNWAREYLEQLTRQPWDANVNPTYLEVSFSNVCNFRCSYCQPDISSRIWRDYEENGGYPTSEPLTLKRFYSEGRVPYKREEENPYVVAFWKWLPEVYSDLQVLRITGGEPLLSKNTSKLLEFVSAHPRPDLELSVNTNLGIPDRDLEKFFVTLRKLIRHNSVGSFCLFTSVDTHGSQAEYLRDGLSYKKFFENVNRYLTEFADEKLTFMCTYNILSIPKFKLLLADILELKRKHAESNRNNRIVFDTNFLVHPKYLSPRIGDKRCLQMANAALDFMKSEMHDPVRGYGFIDYEVKKLERAIRFQETGLESAAEISVDRKDFLAFQKSYDSRRDLSFLKTFPEFESIVSSW